MMDSFLPIDFITRMEQDLGPDFHAFLRSYEENKISALRLNPIKADERTLTNISELVKEQVKWCPMGYYYDEASRPGIHPYHSAGVFYIQDASAQLPVEMLDVDCDDKVLDLCAAPGGKSTQIAGKLTGDGFLVANEPMKNRAKILSENIERLGITNALVISEYPDKLAQCFVEYFDKIMVDAPCSGEGMFRKNHDACAQWSLENVEMCAQRQAQILDCAYEMLKPGGGICYSTCTFSRLEDELCVEDFIRRHPDMKLVNSRRLWPHIDKGEGQFAAYMTKATTDFSNDERKDLPIKKLNEKEIKDYIDFEKKALKVSYKESLVLNNDQLYSIFAGCPDYSRLHVLRAGLHLGTFKKNRFEPSHALALASSIDTVQNVVDLKMSDSRVDEYLHGQTISADVADGWCLIAVDGYSLGWGKAVKGQIKNHYPKGLRLM